MLNWANRFSTFCFLDNHQYQLAPHTEECLLAAGVKREYKAMAGGALEGLQEMINASPSWLFGHLGYDLQLETAGISSSCPDRIGFPDCFFFEPVYLIRLTDNQISISGPDPVAIWQEIQDEPELPAQQEKRTAIKGRYTKETYISVLEQLKKHILRGDCYEINFCQEFYSEDSLLNPLSVYRDLSRVSPNPFSALYRQDDHWLVCASPERFLRKEGRRILSQPIKGTARRNSSNADQDLAGKEALQRSEKDRSENVMVVDLVRNDLSRVCEEGSVKVDELFGVYSFPQVHQMISTVSGQVREDLTFADLIRATFPMGSMTGAPKKRVMELIREYENSRRGIFSGALGYISPAGDFDFNVVIRSIMYNAGSGYLSFQAGSGITWYSDPEKEWEECLLKASAIEAVLR
ncbi:MAG: aminodeoxychorismate synthase component I [Chitinophagaceae bacterium]|nr:aminodeoxychorismate synthase component I [Chitinophagaceae bacterium]